MVCNVQREVANQLRDVSHPAVAARHADNSRALPCYGLIPRLAVILKYWHDSHSPQACEFRRRQSYRLACAPNKLHRSRELLNELKVRIYHAKLHQTAPQLRAALGSGIVPLALTILPENQQPLTVLLPMLALVHVQLECSGPYISYTLTSRFTYTGGFGRSPASYSTASRRIRFSSRIGTIVALQLQIK